ncbi:hypothetical protein GGS24DRAFT_224932 [Hypoxylon argillaceum]|nr:hypothetical protein GGS24DRAFT_224932 [Hypoxylon argillaceum]KAI1155927.1 hypothetical protein F4825DRAFT_406181 [Nemania diffusa]
MAGGITTVRRPPPYSTTGPSQHSSGSARAEPTGLSSWQKRWNMEWLNEAYIPSLRRTNLLMERSSNRDNTYNKGKNIPECRDQFLSNAEAAGIVANPKSAVTQTRCPHGTRHLSWPIRMLASDTKGLWGRWRKHRKDAKTWQVVAVMEERGDTPRWRGEMRFTFQEEFFAKHAQATSINEAEWIPFPSGEDIKWFWIRPPGGGRMWLQGVEDAQHWGPLCRAESCIPFAMVNGRVVRDCRPANAHTRADGNVFDNFVQCCQHCGGRT